MKHFTALAILTILLLSCSPGKGEVEESFGQGNRYARGFSMQECGGCTVVRLRNPWDTLHIRATYILIPENEDLPDNPPQGILIRTPLRNVALFTSIYASVLDEIGALDAVSGVCEPEYMTCKAAKERMAAGKIVNLGNSLSPNAERIIDTKADAVMASPFENAGYGVAEKLGIPVIEAADYMESEPLGRCEWVRFYGRLFDRAAQADSLFEATVQRYEKLRSKASEVQDHPKVLLEKRYGSSWFIPSGDSFTVALHRDAGADYVFSSHRGSNNVPFSSEAVFEQGRNADFWLFKYAAGEDYTRTSLLEEYSLYGGVKAFEDGAVYGCNTLLNDYYNDITLHPDLILEDLVRIYHPEILPLGELRYYKKLNE